MPLDAQTLQLDVPGATSNTIRVNGVLKPNLHGHMPVLDGIRGLAH